MEFLILLVTFNYIRHFVSKTKNQKVHLGKQKEKKNYPFNFEMSFYWVTGKSWISDLISP